MSLSVHAYFSLAGRQKPKCRLPQCIVEESSLPSFGSSILAHTHHEDSAPTLWKASWPYFRAVGARVAHVGERSVGDRDLLPTGRERPTAATQKRSAGIHRGLRDQLRYRPRSLRNFHMQANDARKMTDTAPLVRSLALPRKSSNGAPQKYGGMLNWQRARPEMSSLPHTGVPWRFGLLRLRCRGCPRCIPTRTGDSRLDTRRVRFGRSSTRNR
jgi:hypothetical protein